MNWQKLSFSVPIAESAKQKNEFVIKGIAINEVTTRNNVRYIAEELKTSAHSLVDKPLLKDHTNSVDAIVGRVTNSFYDPVNRNIRFEARVVDKDMENKIRDGLITSVSVGAMVRDLVREEKDGEESDYLIAKGIEFVELSLVSVPADPNAGLAIAEAYQLKDDPLEESHTFSYDLGKVITDEKLIVNPKQEGGIKMEQLVEEKKDSQEDVLMLKEELKQELLEAMKEVMKELKEQEDPKKKKPDEEEVLSKDEEESLEEEKMKELKGLVGGETIQEEDDDYLGIERNGNKFNIFARYYPPQYKKLQGKGKR